MHLKTPLPIAKNSIERREETHQPPHVVCSAENVDEYVVRRRLNHMVKPCGRSREAYSTPSSAGVVL